MKLCWCTVAVGNMEESLKFYQEIVGLSLNNRFKGGPDAEIAFLGEGDAQVELMHNAEHMSEVKSSAVSLGFEVDSVENKLGFLKEYGIEVESGPFQPNPHMKFFFIKDPNGVRIQFIENM